MGKLLIADDDRGVRLNVAQAFAGKDVQVFEADTAARALQLAAETVPDLTLLDTRLGSASGLDIFRELRQLDPECLIVFITGQGAADTAIEAMKLGAYDYLVKPLDVVHLQKVVEQAFAISHLMRVAPVAKRGERPDDLTERLVGSGPTMHAVCRQIGRVAPQEVNVLVFGESGTGKELVARAIYHHSRRRRASFLAINCAAIPETLLESELFGHEQGAFTGADRRRLGKFEQCHGGTLLLDEVGDMSLNTQAKILRLLEEQSFERLGGNESISVDVRVIAATNQNLEQAISDGRFRKDLYYRLRGVTISLPPLRERREDIAELAHYFLLRCNRKLNTAVHSISPAAMTMLESYNWPGNVRELQSVIWESLIASAGMTILPEFLPGELHQAAATTTETEADILMAAAPDWKALPRLIENALQSREKNVYRRARDFFDRLLISRAMQQTQGNQFRAAEILGLSRVTLRSKLRAMCDTVPLEGLRRPMSAAAQTTAPEGAPRRQRGL